MAVDNNPKPQSAQLKAEVDQLVSAIAATHHKLDLQDRHLRRIHHFDTHHQSSVAYQLRSFQPCSGPTESGKSHEDAIDIMLEPHVATQSQQVADNNMFRVPEPISHQHTQADGSCTFRAMARASNQQTQAGFPHRRTGDMCVRQIRPHNFSELTTSNQLSSQTHSVLPMTTPMTSKAQAIFLDQLIPDFSNSGIRAVRNNLTGGGKTAQPLKASLSIVDDDKDLKAALALSLVEQKQLFQQHENARKASFSATRCAAIRTSTRGWQLSFPCFAFRYLSLCAKSSCLHSNPCCLCPGNRNPA